MRDPQAKNREHAQALRQQGIAVVELDISSAASCRNYRGVSADQAKVVFNTNVVGLLRTNRATLPTMRTQGGGLIINIGSILGCVTFPFFGAMSALTPV